MAPRQPADGTPFRPYGGPAWNPPKMDKDGRVSHPIGATSAMYGTPAPSRYSLPDVTVTRKKAPRWTVAGDALKPKSERIGVGPAGYDQDPRCTSKGVDYGKHYTIAPQYSAQRKDENPAAYPNCEADHLKNHLSTLRRAPNFSNRKDLPVRVGKYVPGPAFYPIMRFPIAQYHLTPQKGRDPIVASKPQLLTSINDNPAPNNYSLPAFDKTRLRSHAPLFSMRARTKDPAAAARSPGPAAYNTEAIAAIQKRVPSYSFGINGSCYTNMLGDLESKSTGREKKHCKIPPKYASLRYGKDV